MIVPEKIDNDIIKTTSLKTGVSKSDIEDVFYFHWKSALEATAKYKSLEITTLFRMTTKKKKMDDIKRKMENCVTSYDKQLSAITDERERNKILKKIESANDCINYINTKI